MTKISISGIRILKEEKSLLCSNYKSFNEDVLKNDLFLFEVSDGSIIIGYESKADYFKEAHSFQILRKKYPLLSERGIETFFFN